MQPWLDLDHDRRRADALFLCGVIPTLVCALHRLASGLDPVEPDPDLGWAANYLWMLNGVRPRPEAVDAIERYLILTLDHGFNASTFTARGVALDGADLGACVIAALGASRGPLHGGAPSRALDLLDEIGGPAVLDDPDPLGRIDAVVRPKIEAGDRIMGFGHAVYRGADPRSTLLRDIALRIGGDQARFGVEGLLKRRHGRVEGIRRAVIDLTSLDDTLFGKGTHALWNGGVETEETKLRRRSAVRGASLIGGGLGIGGSIHHVPLGVTSRAMFGLAAAEPRSRKGALRC